MHNVWNSGRDENEPVASYQGGVDRGEKKWSEQSKKSLPGEYASEVLFFFFQRMTESLFGRSV